MADPVNFTRPAAERIARAVRAVEYGNRDSTGPSLDRPWYGGGGGFKLQLGTFTGNWQTGQYTTVTLHGLTQTASVYNWCNPALGGNTTESRYVIFGKVRGTHSAVELPMQELTRLGTISTTWGKGSNATVTQVKGDGSPVTPSVTFTAKNWFATITVSSGTKKVACAKVDNTWILVAAEC